MNSRVNAIKDYGTVLQHNGSYLTDLSTKAWFNEEGQFHRVDGPAIVYADGRVYWYLNDNESSFKEWLKLTPITDEQKLILRLQYA